MTDRFGEGQRKPGRVSAVAVIVGSTIGSGISRTPAEVASHEHPLHLSGPVVAEVA